MFYSLIRRNSEKPTSCWNPRMLRHTHPTGPMMDADLQRKTMPWALQLAGWGQGSQAALAQNPHQPSQCLVLVIPWCLPFLPWTTIDSLLEPCWVPNQVHLPWKQSSDRSTYALWPGWSAQRISRILGSWFKYTGIKYEHLPWFDMTSQAKVWILPKMDKHFASRMVELTNWMDRVVLHFCWPHPLQRNIRNCISMP